MRGGEIDAGFFYVVLRNLDDARAEADEGKERKEDESALQKLIDIYLDRTANQ